MMIEEVMRWHSMRDRYIREGLAREVMNVDAQMKRFEQMRNRYTEFAVFEEIVLLLEARASKKTGIGKFFARYRAGKARSILEMRSEGLYV
jgi:hypothetical protein